MLSFNLLGNDVTRANLMLVLKGVERLVTYNGRSIPDKVKGYVGFDFPGDRSSTGSGA